MAINGAPAQMLAGGAVAAGPAAGIYHIVVKNAQLIESRNTGRPGLKLEMWVENDPNHAAKNGKKLLTQTYYGEHTTDDDDKKKVMRGMLKRGPFAGFGVTWPKENKAIDARVFVNKTAFVLLGLKKKEKETDDDFMEVKAIAQEREKLEKAAESIANTDPGTTKPAKAPASRR